MNFELVVDFIKEYIQLLMGNDNKGGLSLTYRAEKKYPVKMVKGKNGNLYDANKKAREIYFNGLVDAYDDIRTQMNREELNN